MESQLQTSDPLDEQRIALIAGWRASLLNENLLKPADLRRPIVRIAALQRILQTPEWDSRYKSMWLEIETAIGDDRKVLFLQNAVQLARQGGKPNVSEVNSLLALLESQDIASRAMSDFLLRQFYVRGPMFDPNWTDEANLRGAGLWRRFAAAAAAANR